MPKVPNLVAIQEGLLPMRELGYFPIVFCAGPGFICISVSFFIHNEKLIKDNQMDCPFPHVPYSLQSAPCPCCEHNIASDVRFEGRFMIKVDETYELEDYTFPSHCIDLSPAEIPVDVVKYLNIAH